MGEEREKPGWVLWSDGSALEDTPIDQRPISALAIVETIAASAFGFWIWTRWGFYPLLISSLVMAFLTMLRSPASVKLAVKWWESEQETDDIPLKSVGGFAFLLVSIILTWGVVWVLAQNSLAAYSGWPALWRAALLSFIATNLAVFALAALIVSRFSSDLVVASTISAILGAIVICGFVAGAWGVAGALVALMVLTVGLTLAIGSNPTLQSLSNVAFATLIGLGAAHGFLVQALVLRAGATLRHIHHGLPRFARNFTVLVTTVDAWTEPELIPGLPQDSQHRFRRYVRDLASYDSLDRVDAIISLPIFFLPAWIFRLTLKSTFLVYWPLILITTTPKAARTEHGRLTWDDMRGQGELAWGGVAIALLILGAIGYSIYEPAFYQGLVIWADPREMPSHLLMHGVGLNFAKLSLWEWSLSGAAVLTLILFCWDRHIARRLRKGRPEPRWLSLKFLYFLSRLRVLLVAVSILSAIYAAIWYGHDTCRLPDWSVPYSTWAFGPQFACAPL